MRACWPFLALMLFLPRLLLGETVCHHNDTDLTPADRNSTNVLSRRRRLAFPKGSTFVMTLSILQAVQLPLPSNWNLDFEFDVIWPIPSQGDLRKKFFIKRPSKLKRRHRRELYVNFETALNSQNFPGRQCVLRAICEVKSTLSPPGVSFTEDVIRLILSNFDDPDEMDSYDIAYELGQNCEAVYPCPVSFLQLILFNLYTNTDIQ